MNKSCPICESQDISDFNKYETFNLVICNNCDLVFREDINVLNFKQLIDEIYNEDWVSMRRQYLKDTFLGHSIFNTLLLEMFKPEKGCLLEIGSGTGEFLFSAQSAGWDVTGLEPSARASRFAADELKVNIINGIWDINRFQKKFDVVVFWHVLEHITRPKQFLLEVSSILKEDGLIVFSLPNKNSFTNQVMGKLSPLYTEKDHVAHYSPKNLALLIEQVGLQVISMFSRQEPSRLISDVRASVQFTDKYASLGLTDMIGLMLKLQGKYEGHELFCVTRKIQS